jgi:sugar lactone lactonase YvrE
MNDGSGAVYQYSKDGILRRVIDNLHFPNGIAVSPDNSRLAIGDCTASRMVYALFATGPTVGVPGAKPDPLHLTFQTVRAGTYFPGAGCPDGLHYDVKGNLWIAAGGLGGVIQVDPRGVIVGFVPIPAGRRSGDDQPRFWRPGQQGDLCDVGQQRHVLALQDAQPRADWPRRHPLARAEVRARLRSHVC